MIYPIDHINPNVRNVRLNTSPTSARSFIDPEYVFTYIKQGQGIYVIEGVEYQISAGDMILMAPYMLHITRSLPGQEMIQCVVHFDLFYRATRKRYITCQPGMTFEKYAANTDNPETLLVHAPMIRASPPDSVQAQIYRQYEKIRELNKQHKAPYTSLLMRAAMLEILVLYLQQTDNLNEVSTQRSHNWRNIETAIAYIHNHFDEPISLDEISQQAQISVNYFCTLFKQYTGQTIHRYINELRIHKAKRLIEESDLNMSQIADLTGLGDIHAFSKIFKKFEKQTPSAFRRSIKHR
jgi:AraC-like DNA-binding protein